MGVFDLLPLFFAFPKSAFEPAPSLEPSPPFLTTAKPSCNSKLRTNPLLACKVQQKEFKQAVDPWFWPRSEVGTLFVGTLFH
ncbi:hypothetical protein HMI56_007645 [Coelomomyces lativittatus]|nr:hypothetical protein HMI56_007645 [Coelomomyces lativittatus]